jgi:membrane-associated phospholipid phosphatase
MAYKAAWGVAGLFVQSAVYYPLGHMALARSPTLLQTPLDRAIPFLVWTTWFYLPVYLGIFVIAVIGFRTRVMFDRALVCVAGNLVVAALGHYFVRAEYPRPLLVAPYPDASSSFLAWVHAIDPPGNVFPSLHVAHTSVLAFLLYRDRPRLGAVTIGLAAVLAVSTLTTKQHFITDVIAGYAMAFAGRAWALRDMPGRNSTAAEAPAKMA